MFTISLFKKLIVSLNQKWSLSINEYIHSNVLNLTKLSFILFKSYSLYNSYNDNEKMPRKYILRGIGCLEVFKGIIIPRRLRNWTIHPHPNIVKRPMFVDMLWLNDMTHDIHFTFLKQFIV